MIPWWEMIIRLLLAMLLGGILGYERDVSGKPAGLRTIVIVSLSAAIFTLAAQQAAQKAFDSQDNVRAMAGIAQGVGFLGAGIILRSGGEVRWLTTAATVWVAAAIGMSSGMGMYLIAIVGAVLIFITLHWLRALEDRIHRHQTPENKAQDSNKET